MLEYSNELLSGIVRTTLVRRYKMIMRSKMIVHKYVLQLQLMLMVSYPQSGHCSYIHQSATEAVWSKIVECDNDRRMLYYTPIISLPESVSDLPGLTVMNHSAEVWRMPFFSCWP